jgi:DNA-binding NtrC family response regulator
MSPHARPQEPRITAAIASRDRVWVGSLASSLGRFSIDVLPLVPGASEVPWTLDGVDVLIVDSGSLTASDLATVDTLHASHPLVEVLAIAGDSSVADAVRALRAGAFTVLQHPVSDARLVEALLAAGQRHRHARARLEALNGSSEGHRHSQVDRPPARAKRPRRDER